MLGKQWQPCQKCHLNFDELRALGRAEARSSDRVAGDDGLRVWAPIVSMSFPRCGRRGDDGDTVLISRLSCFLPTLCLSGENGTVLRKALDPSPEIRLPGDFALPCLQRILLFPANFHLTKTRWSSPATMRAQNRTADAESGPTYRA